MYQRGSLSRVRCEGTEIGNKYPTDPDILKEKVELQGLREASQRMSTNLCTESHE